MENILFLKPILVERIWGGNKIPQFLSLKDSNSKIGECWAISAHPSGDCIILNGELKGKTLSEIYSSNRDLFANNISDKFPLIIKIIDANDDLSIQVHPDNEYARKYENQFGKNEAWYFLDIAENGKVIIGHNAKNKEELKEYIKDNKWGELLSCQEAKIGDFHYIPAGTVHALLSGSFIYEVQQSSDVTYRLYDYDRVDDKGNKRELHLDKAVEVITYDRTKENIAIVNNLINAKETIYHQGEFFSLKKLEVNGIMLFKNPNKNFYLVNVISLNGKATINNKELHLGDGFIITSKCQDAEIKGNVVLMIAYL